MSIENEGTPAPTSIEAQAIAELEKEGHVVGDVKNQPNPNDEEIKDTPIPPKEVPKVEEKPKEDAPKPERTPTMVEAWKLEVATKQNEKHQKEVADLQAKIEELSKQKETITQTQKDDIAEEIKALAGDKEVDTEFFTKFADTILKKAESKYKPSVDVEKTLKEFKDSQELNKQLLEYNTEFDKDVAPLVKDYQLSDQALSDMKNALKDLAFSETYMKVPLKEIFQIKQSMFNLTIPKKSSEGKGIKTRTNDVIDLDNVDEESFAKMTPEQVEAFTKKQSGNWNTRK